MSPSYSTDLRSSAVLHRVHVRQEYAGAHHGPRAHGADEGQALRRVRAAGGRMLLQARGGDAATQLPR
jgi:hypothetical protein